MMRMTAGSSQTAMTWAAECYFKFLVGLLAEAGLVPLMTLTEKEGPDLCIRVARCVSELKYGSYKVCMDGLFEFGSL